MKFEADGEPGLLELVELRGALLEGLIITTADLTEAIRIVRKEQQARVAPAN